MSKADLWRSYGFKNRPSSGMIRWKSNERKSILWFVTSRIVRIRDWRRYGTCISCGVPIDHWRNGDAGHYIAVSQCGDPAMVFNLLNLNLECNRCNAFEEGHLIGYGISLDYRNGPGTALLLYESHKRHKHPISDWSQPVYHAKILEAVGTLRGMDLPEGLIL